MRKPDKNQNKEQTIQTMEEFEHNTNLDMLEENEDMLITKEEFDLEFNTVERMLKDTCDKANTKYKYNYGAAQDGMLMHCKDLALRWMREPRCGNDEEVEILWNYVLLSLEYLRLLKVKHGMKTMQSVPWVELNQGLKDGEILGMTNTTEEVNLTKVFREIEFLSVQFVFLYSIFEKIIQERNIFVH